MAPIAAYYRSRCDGGNAGSNPAARISDDYIDVVKRFRSATNELQEFDFINNHRDKGCDVILSTKKSFETCQRRIQLESIQPPHATAFKLDCALLEALLVKTDYPYDAKYLCASLSRGAENPCDIPFLGLGSPIERQRPPKASKNKRRKIEFRFDRPNFPVIHLEELERLMMEDVSAGYCSAPQELDSIRLSIKQLSYAFPVLKAKYDDKSGLWNDKVRACVDERAKNAECYIASSIKLDDLRSNLEALVLLCLPRQYLEPGRWDGLVQLPRQSNVDYVVTEEHKRDLEAKIDNARYEKQTVHCPDLAAYYVDLIAAYRQLIFRDPLENVVGFWSVKHQKYLYVSYYSLTFGALVSVHWFLAFAGALTHITRKLGICVGGFFFDDGNYIEDRRSVHSGFKFLTTLLTALNVDCHLVPPKSGLGQRVRMLGAELDFTTPDLVQVDTPMEKRLQLHDLLVQASDNPETKLLQKCLGIFVFLLTVTLFRSGYHRIRGLFTLTNEAFSKEFLKYKTVVRHYLLGLAALALDVQPLRLRPSLFLDAVTKLEVDAMCDFKIGRIGGFIDTPQGKFGLKLDIMPSTVLARSKIMYLEVLAVLIGLRVFSQFVNNRRLRIVSDNQSGMYSIIQGYAKYCLHTHKIVGDIHDFIRNHGSTAWLEYRLSQLNDADRISRDDVPDDLKMFPVPYEWIPVVSDEELAYLEFMFASNDCPKVLRDLPAPSMG